MARSFKLMLRILLVVFLLAVPGAALAKPAGWVSSTAGAPDDFGYQWQEITNAYTDQHADMTKLWKTDPADTSTGVQVTFGVGFEFPFYEHTYTSMMACNSGLLLFGATTCPDLSTSNRAVKVGKVDGISNFITTLGIDTVAVSDTSPTGLYGRQLSDRYELMFFNDTMDLYYYENGPNYLVYLFQNGDIEIHYGGLDLTVPAYSIGMEHVSEEIGLQIAYVDKYANVPFKAYKITRPAPAERLFFFENQGRLVSPGATALFDIAVYNAGDLDLPANSTLTLTNDNPACVIKDGSTPVTAPFTLLQGESKALTVSLSMPATAVPGDKLECTLDARLGQDFKRVTVLGTVAHAFVQTFGLDGVGRFDPAGFFTYQSATESTVKQLFAPDLLANADKPVTTWLAGDRSLVVYARGVTDMTTNTEEHTLISQVFGKMGAALSQPKTLDTHTVVDKFTVEEGGISDLAVETNADGEAGIAWTVLTLTVDADDVYTWKIEIKFAVIGPDGEFISGPVTVREIDHVGLYSEPSPEVGNVNMAVNAKGEFGLIWTETWATRANWTTEITDDNIVYCGLNRDGSKIAPEVIFKSETLPNLIYLDPTLTPTKDGSFLVLYGSQERLAVYTRDDASADKWKMVINSNGTGAKQESRGDVIAYDTLLLPNGDILAAAFNAVHTLDGSTFEAQGFSAGYIADPDHDGLTYPQSANLVLASATDVIFTFTNSSKNLYYQVLTISGGEKFPPIPIEMAVNGVAVENVGAGPYSLHTYYHVPYNFSTPIYLPIVTK